MCVYLTSQDNNNFVSSHADELLDASNSPPRQLREENHAIDIVILEELDICPHVGNLPKSVPGQGFDETGSSPAEHLP